MTILILGATSDIGKALAYRYALVGHNLILTARKSDQLEPLKSDLELQYPVSVQLMFFDALKYDLHSQFYASIKPSPDIVICVFGYLGDHEKAKSSFEEAKLIVNSNYTGCISILNIVADDFEKRKSGTIIGISSVAGDRGRQSNYYYGSAKAGFTAYLSGLRNRLVHSGVHVMTVKPGFVRTRMTKNAKLPAPITASPEQVAKDIFKYAMKRKNVLYTLRRWALIMLVIKWIPEWVFKKLKL